jgi:aryl-alcohol dehydrogenase-like predicted oxidoreductase
MHKRHLGRGAPEVSAAGFGGMPLSIAGRPDPETGVRVLHASLDAGVTLIDTADVYCLDDDDMGHNERLVARALREWPGDSHTVIVATKGGLRRPQGRWENEARPERLKRACDDSLRALGVETIDLYQLHAPDRAVPFADSVGALADLLREGKIRWVGLSNVSVQEIRQAQDIVEVTTVQNRLSPFFREAIETGVVEYTAREGIGFLAYSPVGGGRLNRKLPGHPVVSRLAGKHGTSPHAVVLAWVLSRAPNVIIIPGARTEEHAVDSAGAPDLRLDPDDLAAVDAAEFSIA